MTQRLRDICFTSYLPSKPTLGAGVTYLVFQREKCPETERLHWQGFAQATHAKSSFKAWQKALAIGSSHIEKRHGTATQARDYCMASVWDNKDKGQIPDTTEEHGAFDPKESEGARSDLDTARETILGKRRWNDVVNDASLTKVLSRNLPWAKAIFNAKPPQPMTAPAVWRPWQQELLDLVTSECTDDRTIHWVYDPDCGAGKSTLTKFLIRNHGAIVLCGKTADVLHGYDDEEIVIFDIPKDAQKDDKDFIPYGAIEKIKDGTYFSGKYEGRMHCRPFEAHVIVFANCQPKEGCWDPARTRHLQLSSGLPQFDEAPAMPANF